MKSLIKEQRGVSLLEVLITALMIGLLSAIVTLSVDYYLTDGKDRIVDGDLATLTAATRLYILDHGFPATFDPTTALVPAYLPELPSDPYAAANLIYVIQLRPDPADNITKIYIGSRGEDGQVDYGVINNKDDIFRYVK